MVPRKRNKRLMLLGGGALLIAGATGLTITALSQNIDYFYAPSDLDGPLTQSARRIRLGGLVAEGSVRDGAGVEKIFDVTDGGATVTVTYDGILPALFREGQGVIAQGRFGANGVFDADLILAKHDENYKPKELQDALDRAGHPGETQDASAAY